MTPHMSKSVFCFILKGWSGLVLTFTEILTHGSFVGHGVHAERQLLLWVLVKFLPQRKRLGNHLALLDPLGFIVTAANNPGTGTEGRMNIQYPLLGVVIISLKLYMDIKTPNTISCMEMFTTLGTEDVFVVKDIFL